MSDESIVEPNPVIERDWTTEARLRAVALRRMLLGPPGFLCGYVRVPNDHPLFECEYMHDTPDALCGNTPEAHFDVHGGITYSGFGMPGVSVARIHKKDWWYGFDCNHAGDRGCGSGVMRAFLGDESSLDGAIRDLSYVEAECEKLASELADVAQPQRRKGRDHA